MPFAIHALFFLRIGIDEDFRFATVVEVFICDLVAHPLFVAKTLIRLGHEPFAINVGRTLMTGREAYYLPDMFTYAKLLAKEHGWRVLFTSSDAAALRVIFERCAGRWTENYLDAHFPDMGGPPEDLGVPERRLTDGQSLRRAFRRAMRATAFRTVAVIVARPFTVICIRQIAQLVGGESKYLNVYQAFRLIAEEEGVGGLMAGLMPQLCTQLMLLWGYHTMSYAVERAFVRVDLPQKIEGVLPCMAFICKLGTAARIDTLTYSLTVVGTVMAVVGSGLTVSLLPNNPSFGNWHDCYDYLKNTPEHPSALSRGIEYLFRETSIDRFVMSRKQK